MALGWFSPFISDSRFTIPFENRLMTAVCRKRPFSEPLAYDRPEPALAAGQCSSTGSENNVQKRPTYTSYPHRRAR